MKILRCRKKTDLMYAVQYLEKDTIEINTWLDNKIQGTPGDRILKLPHPQIEHAWFYLPLQETDYIIRSGDMIHVVPAMLFAECYVDYE